jgi:hypothetical protein
MVTFIFFSFDLEEVFLFERVEGSSVRLAFVLACSF